MKKNALQEAVYQRLRRVPKGKVTTYGALARSVGTSPRAVGVMLSRNLSRAVPCHRVVASHGGISGYNRGVPAKIRLLKKEGIAVSGAGSSARIDLSRFGLISL